MRARSKVVVKTSWLTLTRYKSRTTDRVCYAVKANLWSMPGYNAGNAELTLQVADHFNPGKNRGTGLSWKFSNRQEAEHLITIAIMKWGS
jgi:hypothetical protein